MFTNFEIMSNQSHDVVRFFFPVGYITLKGRNRLKDYLLAVFKKEGKKVAFVNYVFCSDQYLLEINRNYLNHDYYTDIITFDLSDKKGALKAEIYISIDRIRENARKLGVSLKSELHRVIFHGSLHLCGYDDKTAKQQTAIRLKEDLHLKKYNP
jgi:rRNA maturation RNase YbeY